MFALVLLPTPSVVVLLLWHDERHVHGLLVEMHVPLATSHRIGCSGIWIVIGICIGNRARSTVTVFWVNIESASGAVGRAVGVLSETALSVNKIVGFFVLSVVLSVVASHGKFGAVVLLLGVVEGVN